MNQQNSFKTPLVVFLDRAVYWTGIGMAIIANFLLSVALLPFLIALKGVWLYSALAFIALSFGAVMDAVLRMVQHISQQQIIAELFIPTLALINIYIMAGLANTLSTKIGMNTTHNALLISIVYVVAFSTPHFMTEVLKKKSEGKTI